MDRNKNRNKEITVPKDISYILNSNWLKKKRKLKNEKKRGNRLGKKNKIWRNRNITK